MLFTLTDLKQKEIVDTNTGVILGRADDIRFDSKTANVESVIIYGRPKLFGFLGRDGDLSVKFENITLIGKDAILVTSSETIELDDRKPRALSDKKREESREI